MSEAEIEQAVAAYRAHPVALPLNGVVQHYEWGGFHFIPALLGVENDTRKPYAELWIGAHPSAPASTEVEGISLTLDRLAAGAPEALLGPAAARFGARLPYLFKVLDARQMLSIQAHPTKAQAQEGFARENAAGVPMGAAHRNYKDDNHKPEVHVALTDFWLLHGFRPLDEIAQILRTVPELTPLMPDFARRLAATGSDAPARKDLLRTLYGTILTLPQTEVDARLNPLIERLRREETDDKNRPDFWALRAAESFPLPGGHRDRGIFSIYLLNLVHLRPGEGTFQAAGTLHAYLEGVNMELMASSDNVLRGGLTPKHVDVGELMQTLRFEDGAPEVLAGNPDLPTETVYPTPAPEFVLSRIEVSPGRPHAGRSAAGPDTLLVLEGAATIRAGDRTFSPARGDILLVPPGVEYHVEAQTGSATLFKAAVPVAQDVPA